MHVLKASPSNDTVDGSEILRSPTEIGSLFHYLQGFSTIPPPPHFLQDFFHQLVMERLYIGAADSTIEMDIYKKTWFFPPNQGNPSCPPQRYPPPGIRG